MNVDLFVRPTSHPFNMLEGYTNASEKESVLAWILRECIDAGDWVVVKTTHNHSTMVLDGLLERVTERQYRLTEKSKGLLYTQFHKVEKEK